MYMFPTLRDLPDTSHLFFYRPSLLLNTTFSTSFVSLGPTGAWPLPCTAAFLSHTPLDFFSCFTTFCNMVHLHPSSCPGHLMISPLTALLMDAQDED